MAAQGAWTWFDRALLKIATGVINLNSDSFKMALCGNAQTLTALFVGSSADARYADLTAELATANGYTVGGVSLSSLSLARGAANQVIFTSASAAWTFTGGGVTFKYAVIYDNTGANKDLLGYVDMDTGGGTVSPVVGITFNPDPTYGWLYWTQ